MEHEKPSLGGELVGLVAGSGEFPIQFTKNAISQGRKVVVVAHRGETAQDIESFGAKVSWIKVGQLGKLIKIFKREGVKNVAFAGGISRPNLFSGNLWIDFRGLTLLARTKSVNDDVLLRSVVKEMESEGLSVFSATEFLPECIASQGQLTRRGLTSEESKNGLIGWQAAKLIGSVEIGQTVVVSQGMVVAVEAIEGTDQTILRAGELTQGKGGVVVKVSKPQQDNRLDLPTVGSVTIDNMRKAGLSALLIESGKTIILDPLEVVSRADKAKIAIVSFAKLP